jgi:hypothetical protein
MSDQSRQLWQSSSPPGVARSVVHEDNDDSDNKQESYNDIFQRFSSRPAPRSLLTLCSNALVVGQEFSLACFLLARHRVALDEEERHGHHFLSTTGGGKVNLAILALQQQQQLQQQRVDRSTLAMLLALSVAVIYSARSNSNNNSNNHTQDRTQKVKQRVTDACLLAVLLRLVASVLRTLTASYSSDTVQALAIAGMMVHVLACDYSYANGKGTNEPGTTSAAVGVSGMHQRQQQRRRPIFQGGTISLNAALFSTTLIVSRLSSNLTAYFFVTMAIVMFCFYPAARHAIAATYPPSTSCKSSEHIAIELCSTLLC